MKIREAWRIAREIIPGFIRCVAYYNHDGTKDYEISSYEHIWHGDCWESVLRKAGWNE